MTTPPTPTIDTLLRLTAHPTGPPHVLTTLTSHPSLAHAADSTGYTLLHAAASYSALDLLRALVTTYKADANVRDADGDTPLFYAESAEVARCLVEELGADVSVVNEEGVGVRENAVTNLADAEGDAARGWAEVVAYLDSLHGEKSQDGTAQNGEPTETNTKESAEVRIPPRLPEGVRIDFGAVRLEGLEGENGQAPDPEFRRRIEALAARDDFESEEGQQELRRLVEDAVGGLRDQGGEREVRRRVE